MVECPGLKWRSSFLKELIELDSRCSRKKKSAGDWGRDEPCRVKCCSVQHRNTVGPRNGAACGLIQNI